MMRRIRTAAILGCLAVLALPLLQACERSAAPTPEARTAPGAQPQGAAAREPDAEPSGPASRTAERTSDTRPPSVPSRLVASTHTAGVIDLSWSSSRDDRSNPSYIVYRDYVQLAIVRGPAYTDASVQFPSIYCYTVSSIDSAGNESGQSGQECAVPLEGFLDGVPRRPEGLRGAAGNESVSLQWYAVPNASLYNIYVGNERTVSRRAHRWQAVSRENKYELKGLLNENMYYVVVTAIGAKGESEESEAVAVRPSVGARGHVSSAGETILPPFNPVDSINLLLNPDASGSLEHWKAEGNAGIGLYRDRGSVFYVKKDGTTRTRLHQTIVLPPDAEGYIVMAGYMTADMTVESSVSRHPYLDGEMITPRLYFHVEGGGYSRHDCHAYCWQPRWIIKPLLPGTTAFDFSLMQGSDVGDPPDGATAFFDDLECRIFKTREEAEAFVEYYKEVHPKL